jgi:hypothetical protein
MPRLPPCPCVGFSVGPSSGSPSDDKGPPPHGCGTNATHNLNGTSVPPSIDAALIPDTPLLTDLSPDDPPHHTPSRCPTTVPPAIDDAVLPSTRLCLDEPASEHDFPESHAPDYTVCSLTRSALRMLWHQQLGHLNFRRLSTMHRFVKGMPQ